MMPPSAPPLDHLLRRRRSAVMLRLTTIIVPLLLLFNTCLSMQLVENLPGFPGKLPFTLHTGYIGVGENEQVQLFYYFFESESNPQEDPLVLWLKGGIACSGLHPILYELGPLTIDYANSYGRLLPSLTLNEYSWTKVANMILIDQPVGAGFSYSETPEGYYSSDTTAAKHVYDFLKKWLIDNPKYLKNPLYIGGDSYVGLLVPLIVEKVYDGIELGSEPLMNMKGYALGNPLTDRDFDFNARIPYANRMGLISDRLYQSVKELCHENYVLNDMKNVLCLKALGKAYQLIDKIHWVHILEPWCDAEVGDVSEHVMISYKDTPTNFLQSVVTLAKSRCRDDNYVFEAIWANDKSVQEALHVREGKVAKWTICNSIIRTSKTQEEKIYVRNVTSTIVYHKALTHKTCRALIYSGDHDLYVPHISTEKWIESLNMSIQSDWRAWFVDGQVGGYTMTYGEGAYTLTYATIKGAGHESPEYKPVQCFAMIRRWFGQSEL